MRSAIKLPLVLALLGVAILIAGALLSARPSPVISTSVETPAPAPPTAAPSSLQAEFSAAAAPPSNSRIAPQLASQPVGAVRQSGGPPTACDHTLRLAFDLPHPEHFLQWVETSSVPFSGTDYIVLDRIGRTTAPITTYYRESAYRVTAKMFVEVIDVESGVRRTIVDASPQYWKFSFSADVSRAGSKVAYVSCEFLPGGWEFTYPTVSWDAFRSSDTEIVTIGFDGRSHNRLTDNDRNEYFPVWSPSGDRIAFISRPHTLGVLPGEHWIAVVDASGASEVRIEDPLLYPPAWSPDGEDIAFLRGGAGIEYWSELGNVEIDLLVAKSDGSEPPRSIADASAWKLGWRVDSIEFGGPSWSPDGNWIAFGSSFLPENEQDGGVEIAVVSRDGSTKRIIWSGQSDFPVTQVTWSPNGEEILFIATDVFVVRPDGSGLRRIDPFVDPNSTLSPNLPQFTSDSPSVARAAWSPDSSQIALYDGQDTVVTVNRDGADARIYQTPCGRCIYGS